MRNPYRNVRYWQLWSVAEPLRSYITAMMLAAVATACLSLVRQHWQLYEAIRFVALLGCGVVAIESTRAVKEVHGALSRDLQTVWYLAIAITLPPAYAFTAPLLLMGYKLVRISQAVVHRRIFSAATISLGYGCASYVFRLFPASVAGARPGTGTHALAWTAAVALCGIVGWVVNNALLLVAIRLSEPTASFREMLGSREAIVSELVEFSLAISVALIVAINPILMVLALPSIVLYRRYLMSAQLIAQARIDAKTGLLNAVTWRREANAEFSRALRTGAPLSLAMVDIDHFQNVNETAGRDVGDKLLRDVAGMLSEQMRGAGLIGRFGGEEFAILLPRTDGDEAKRISERLRDHIAGEPIAIESGNQAGFVFRLTVSIGVAVINESRRALAELIGAADSALDQAKSTGWNKVYMLSDEDSSPRSGW